MKIEDYKKIDKRYADNLEGSEKRWERMVDFYYSGVKNKEEALKELNITFPSEYNSKITLTKLESEGLCPHHFLPTHYEAEITYIPSNGRVIGTSKPYIAFRAISAQPLLMEDIFDEFFNEFIERVKPLFLKIRMIGKYECNHKDKVNREAEVVIEKEYLKK